ncbi:CBS domain-containing protein [Flavitalea antarctica]
MNKKVTDVLLRKGSNITTVAPNETVIEALKIMADQNIGSVMVMENGKYMGIMTERDYSRKVILKGKSSTHTEVSEIMSDDLPRVTPNDSIDYCMKLMSDKNIRYLPVFENDMIIGIISINDVVKETILSQQETITQLKDYLHSSM